jgi:hypothetical protein
VRLLVTHLTRMREDFVCVAGIDTESGRHVRPLPVGSRMRIRDTSLGGGPFEIGALIDLGLTRSCGTPPEIEDFEFARDQVKKIDIVDDGVFLRLLESTTRTSLTSIFGPELEQNGHTWASLRGTGSASLGCIIPKRLELDRGISTNETEVLRVWVAFDGKSFRLPVTDLRLYRLDSTQRTMLLDSNVVSWLRGKLHGARPCIVTIGLSRAWLRPNDSAPRHWMQLNNIYFADDPYWLGAPNINSGLYRSMHSI